MGEARFVQGNVETIDHTPSSAVAAEEVVAFGDGVAIAHLAIEADRLGALAIGGGTYDFAKDDTSGPTFAVGANVYWDDTNNLSVTSAVGNKYLGKATKAAGASDASVRVHHLQPTPVGGA